MNYERGSLRTRSISVAVVSLIVGALIAASADAAESGSCALGVETCGSEGCWWQGDGTPWLLGTDEPYCIPDENSPPCYICIYNPPSVNWYDSCAENDLVMPECHYCRIGSWPGALPECPSW
jgi:hypothetical protein